MQEEINEKTGIYALGFNPESFAGLILPFLFVIIIGGIGAFLVTR